MEIKEYNSYSLRRGNKLQQRIAKETWNAVQEAVKDIINEDEYLDLVNQDDSSITLDYTKFVTGGVFIFADVKNYTAAKIFGRIQDKIPNLKWNNKRHTEICRGKLRVSVFNSEPNSFKNHIKIYQQIEY